MKRPVLIIALLTILLAGCAAPDLNAAVPSFETGVDPSAWVNIPAGDFLSGQEAKTVAIDYDYAMMTTDVTVDQYAAWLTEALVAGAVKSGEYKGQEAIVGYYPGDEFHSVKHEEEIEAGDWILIPLEDPASRFTFDGAKFAPKPGYENHPMTNVTWFGGRAYCTALGGRLPTELEWEKAARGPATGSNADRAFPWGDEIQVSQANFYASRDPFENMSTFGSRTSPVGFYNGQMYAGFQTVGNTSPYGLYDMAGNVWQWTGNVYTGMHYRFMRGGSKDTYEMDLRVWVRNNATPVYYSPGVGFRCAK